MLHFYAETLALVSLLSVMKIKAVTSCDTIMIYCSGSVWKMHTLTRRRMHVTHWEKLPTT